jgi:hypothetical protein
MRNYRLYGVTILGLFLGLSPFARSCSDDRNSGIASVGGSAGGRIGSGYHRTYHK